MITKQYTPRVTMTHERPYAPCSHSATTLQIVEGIPGKRIVSTCKCGLTLGNVSADELPALTKTMRKNHKRLGICGNGVCLSYTF
jgi:hypothetical protein